MGELAWQVGVPFLVVFFIVLFSLMSVLQNVIRGYELLVAFPMAFVAGIVALLIFDKYIGLTWSRAPLKYHLNRTKDHFRPELKALFKYFKDIGCKLESYKYKGIEIHKKVGGFRSKKCGEIRWIGQQDCLSDVWLRIYTHYYEREDIERLEDLSRHNDDFEVGTWGRHAQPAIDIFRISDFKTIKKYHNEIQEALDSWMKKPRK